MIAYNVSPMINASSTRDSCNILFDDDDEEEKVDGKVSTFIIPSTEPPRLAQYRPVDVDRSHRLGRQASNQEEENIKDFYNNDARGKQLP